METTTEHGAIEQLIADFAQAFNSADVAATVLCYTPGGVAMPNNAPAVKGHEQLRSLYGFLFERFNIQISYQVQEVVISGDYAFARSASKVKTVIKASGAVIELVNKELFVLQCTDGRWLIADYIFNSDQKA